MNAAVTAVEVIRLSSPPMSMSMGMRAVGQVEIHTVFRTYP